MFENYSEDLNSLIDSAKEIAQELNSVSIQPAHFILGIIREKIGLSYFIISYLMNEDTSKLENDIISIIPRTPVISPLNALEYSKITTFCLKSARQIMQKLNDNQVTVEHLLLAILMNVKDSDLGLILKRYNITYSTVFEILRMFGSDPLAKIKKKPKSSTNTPIVNRFCKDLTEEAWLGQLDPIIGREKEIERVMQILSRRMKNNPILIGYPGVGKTAIVEGLAKRIVSGQVPVSLQNKRILQMEMGNIVAGTKYRGEFEDRMNKILKELDRAKNCILFIDEIHTIVGAGGAEGAIDASNILKPFLGRSKVQIIGATTFDEYKKHIEKDKALERRFQTVLIEETSIEQTIEILNGIKERYEEFHNITFTDDAIKLIPELAKKYINERYLPDKAIDILDECGAYLNVKNNLPPIMLKEIKEEMEVLSKEKQHYFLNKQYEKLPEIQKKLNDLYNKYQIIKQKWDLSIKPGKNIVDTDVVALIVSRMTGINVERLKSSEAKKLINMEKTLNKVVIDQKEAISAISRAIRRGRLGIKKLRKPIGSFIFLGPTGVGKTELARRLAEFLFGTQDALIRIDMSDFMEKHNVSRLVGAPPGYVGYQEGGQLTELIRRKPFSVVLFDEIEKAHPDFFNILLQILEEGELLDNLGHKVDFRNTIIIMTSNIGAKDILNYKSPGFKLTDEESLNFEDVKSKVLFQVKKRFNPEFLNRIDELIIFRPLTKKSLTKIIDLMLDEVRENLKQFNINFETTKSVKEFFLENGYDEKYGARPLRRLIQKELEDLLSDYILKGKIKNNDRLRIVKNKNGIGIKIVKKTLQQKDDQKIYQK